MRVIDEGEKWFSNLSAQFKQCALCTILSHCTKCAMLDGKRMKQPPEQSDFNQPSVTFLCFRCPMPVRSFPTSRADFIPCDSFMQRAYCLLTYGHPKNSGSSSGTRTHDLCDGRALRRYRREVMGSNLVEAT